MIENPSVMVAVLCALPFIVNAVRGVQLAWRMAS